MPNVNSQFDGQTLIRPGAYYKDNPSAAQGVTQTQTPPLILIGYGYGGAPNVPSPVFSSADAVLAAIRGGPVGDFVPFITVPSTSPTLNGSNQIVFINAGQNTQSSYSMLDDNGSTVIDFTSVDYGTPSNLLQVQVEDGSLGGRLVTLFDGYSNTTIQQDNLGLSFEVAYTGTASNVSLSIVGSGTAAQTLVISSPNPGESVTVGLTPELYGTVEQVVEYLNGTSYYTATVIGDGTMPSSDLDLVQNVVLPTQGSGPPTFVDVTATLGAIVYWANQYAGNLVSAALPNGVVSSPANRPAVIPLTPFSGGTNVPPTLADYAAAFNAALKIPGWVVFADSNSAGVQALGTQHVLTASSIPEGKPRRFVTGSSLGDTIATTQANAQACDAIQVTYVYPGITGIDTTTGLPTTYSGLYAAAAIAGLISGNRPAQPLTSAPLAGTGVEVQLDTTEINQLQQSGVMPIALNSGNVPSVVSDLTTWQSDNNPENVYNQQVGCRQYLEYVLLQAMTPYIGRIAAPGTLGLVQKAIVDALNKEIYSPGGAGVLVSWEHSSLSLVYDSTSETLTTTVGVTFVGQFRFITLSVPIQKLALAA